MDKAQRYIIANQLKILEALYPTESKYYSEARIAFEEGYVQHYEWAMEHIASELDENITREVVDTLDMYRAIYYFKRDNHGHGFEEADLRFSGYDGNHHIESRLMGYARYFVIDLNRFSEILEEQGEHFDFNSHCEMRDKYVKMVKIWKEIPAGTSPGNRHKLTKDQLKNILGA